MATTTFSIEAVIAAAPAVVGRFLREFPNYQRIHPLIVHIEEFQPTAGRREPRAVVAAPDPGSATGAGVAGGPPERASDRTAIPAPRWYRVTDRLPWGPIPIHITYEVAQTLTGPQTILSEAWQRPRVYLRNQTVWSALAAQSTRLHEEVEVTAPRLLLPLVVRTAKDSHERAFARLAALLAASSAQGA